MNTRRSFFTQLASGLLVAAAPALFLPKLIKPAWKRSETMYRVLFYWDPPSGNIQRMSYFYMRYTPMNNEGIHRLSNWATTVIIEQVPGGTVDQHLMPDLLQQARTTIDQLLANEPLANDAKLAAYDPFQKWMEIRPRKGA